MPAVTTATYALTTVERLKIRLGITVAQTAFDVLLAEMVAGATDFIERYCNRRFKQTAYTQELYDGANVDGTPKMVLILKNAPLSVAPTSFQYRTGSKSNPSWVDFQADTYQEVLSLGIMRTGLPCGFQNIRVSYTAGYLIDFTNEFTSTHTLPYDISDLCERLATKLFKRRESEGKKNESFSNSNLTWGDFLEDHDKSILANYQRITFA